MKKHRFARFRRACVQQVLQFVFLTTAGLWWSVLAASAESCIPMCTQELVIEGEHDLPQIMPVFGGKQWAFSARWDDNSQNSLKMQSAMAAIGLKGTFYLNASKEEEGVGAAFAQALSRDGCSIGGHTHSHFRLPTLNPNALFREILLNRIEREADTDRPLNSFAFPYGAFQDKLNPEAQRDITEAWLRSGYHHCVYSRFVRENPYLDEQFASAGNQVVPGDQVINDRKAKNRIASILSDPEEYRKVDYCISLGVHARQSAAELYRFQKFFAEYTGRDDFWYCNQTDFAAYRLQSTQAKITPVPGKSGVYMLSRPTVAIAGSDIPLTIRLATEKEPQVLLDEKVLPVQSGGKSIWLINLPYPKDQALPQRIGWADSAVFKFPGLKFDLSAQESGGWSLQLKNKTMAAVSNIVITIRLPLKYEDGVRRDFISELLPGQRVIRNYSAGALREQDTFSEGPVFAAAEIDFVCGGTSGRIYATFDENKIPGPENCIRDRVAILGPLNPDTFEWSRFQSFSDPDAKLSPLSGKALGQWIFPSDKFRLWFRRNHIVPSAEDPAWKAAAVKFHRRPAVLVAVLDVFLPESGLLQVASGRPVTHIAVDGEDAVLKNGTIPVMSEGTHRIAMAFHSEGTLLFSRPHPFYLELSLLGTTVDYIWPAH